MFSSKKSERSGKPRSGKNLGQYGLFDIPSDLNFNSGGGSDDEDDPDLEAELAALAGGTTPRPRRPGKPEIPAANLDAMVALSLKDVPSDEELSGDDDDPDILNELSEIAGEEPQLAAPPPSAPEPAAVSSNDIVKTLTDRLKMYEEAEKNAKASGESGRARRFNRGSKTIKDLLKQAQAGKPINNDDIPPEVSTGPRKAAPTTDDDYAAAPTPSRPAPSPPKPDTEPQSSPSEEVASSPIVDVDTGLIQMLTDRKQQFKIAALRAKKSGDNATALRYIKIAKQFDTVISAAQNGQPVDLSRMPAPPADSPQSPKLEENQMQTGSLPDIPVPDGDVPETVLIQASSVAEALEQRLDVYKKQEETAKEQGNSSKVRRMGRIVKQYEQAIKAHKAGKVVPIDELPTPPGYGPIPVPEGQAPPAAKPEQPSPPETRTSVPKSPPSTSQTTRITGNQVPNSRAEKQMALLLAKQKEFKLAALAAKRKGEMEQAKELLRTAKGFEPLIEASSCGLPVDLSTLPISLTAKSQLDDEYDVVMSDECTEDSNSDKDILTRLENQLTKQLKMCLSTRDHHKALGDVAGTNRFERLALNVTKDLDFIRLAKKTPGAGIPKFHYEMKEFSLVKSFTELGDNDLEVTILRGISYTCTNPKEIDTYVKFEVPYPSEEPFKERTSTVKNTNNPEYNATFVVPIQRTARACQRVFKRHSVKLEVYSKGGFFRGDTLIGTTSVKLQSLETQCEVHDSFDLLEGRKKIGGKLEVRLRLRHPIVSQQVEQLQEKWLIIDS